MTFYYISNPQAFSNSIPVPKFQVFLETAGTGGDIIGSRMNFAPVPYGSSQYLNVVGSHAFRVRQNLRDTLGKCNFVNAKIWIRRNDSTS